MICQPCSVFGPVEEWHPHCIDKQYDDFAQEFKVVGNSCVCQHKTGSVNYIGQEGSDSAGDSGA